MKALQQHERRDPTRQLSRVFVFDQQDGTSLCMELYVIPKSQGLLDPQIPHKPNNSQVLQTLSAASQTHIQHFTKP